MTKLPSFSSFTCDWTYDVFLSFRGVDTRENFTSDLYHSLQQKGIRTFMDEEGLKRGEEITQSLIRAIKESRIFIAVFSKNYASSRYCLDELATFVECLKEQGQGRTLLPAFYDVEPSHVRHQKETYGEALAKHEVRFKDDKDKVQKWRDALRQAADLSGWHRRSMSEYQFIKTIVEEVYEKIKGTHLRVANYEVGLESPAFQVKSLIGLDSNDRVNIVGIYGMRGIGKSTLARAVHNMIVDQFNCSCFLADIKERASNHSLSQLQETLLNGILGEKDIKVEDVYRGMSIIKKRLNQKKVLLILDGVDQLKQLQVLAGEHDWFGSGSRIIITTRDKHLLDTHRVVKSYEVKLLSDEKALELFHYRAFKNNKIDPAYVDSSNRAVFYARGLPLTLEVLGSHLFDKSLEKWKSALDKYERFQIHEILKVTYDDLEEDEKGIFLGIACSFNSYNISYVKEILHSPDLQKVNFHAENSIQMLTNKSLIKIDDDDNVRIHELIQDMGREIERQISRLEPGKCSRLRDIVHVFEKIMPTLHSPSTFTCGWAYDVFISFKRVDTFHSFIRHLYSSLCQKRIRFFKEENCVGIEEDINSTLLQAIKKSKIFVVVFSENYASSTRCLSELVIILECLKKDPGQLFIPIFYDVDPLQLQVQDQRGTYAEALAKHEERFKDDKDKVQKWRDALSQAANLSGWHFRPGSLSVNRFIIKKVEELSGIICKKVSEKIKSTPLHVANNPVGMESPVLEVKTRLGLDSNERVNMVGIYGIRGIGKSTLARAVHNLIANQFDYVCFLADIRERASNHSLAQLQETLLNEILGEKDIIKVGDVNGGISIIKNRLHEKKVFVILDDVDLLEQLQVLVGGQDWFGSGSKIIITTRDKHLLTNHGVVKLYEVKPLNDENALELFSWHAFKNSKIDPGYADSSNRAVFYAHGLPLALEAMGSHLFGKSLDVWKSTLDKYERIFQKDINEILNL